MRYLKNIFLLSVISICCASTCFAQQIKIDRIEMMPNKPSPYVMRDWKQVALGYDSLVFNPNLKGEMLPMTIIIDTGTVNYPDKKYFLQSSYVGGRMPSNESINTFMGIIGATLCGVDKRNHYGYDWVDMCNQFYNRANGVNLYGNTYDMKTGGDWWYELIPSLLFYQLYDLYPEVKEFKEQYPVVADKWLSCVYALGGKVDPWTLPQMNYRAFNFEKMKPLEGSVPEPGASGAIGWLLYNAYTKCGDQKYLDGAKLSMEYFSSLTENPSYELQYLYGTLNAARMNAELGTNYDLNKIMNWCFEVGKLRQWRHTLGWGVAVGKWNGMDVSGISAAISKEGDTEWGDYAFLMNTFQQTSILAPVARYNDKYARALGKYILNAANAARLFYSKYLPLDSQTCGEWSRKYDPNSYLAYEGIRQYMDGKSPYASGDPIIMGWAKSDISLYSSSPVGYLGSILGFTDVEAIMQIDLLKTDFSHSKAYPTYLMYNPYNQDKEVAITLDKGKHTLYDATTNRIIAKGVKSGDKITLKADSAVVLVVIPSDGKIVTKSGKAYVKDVIIDYII